MKTFEETLREGFESPESVARELILFIENDGELYHQRTMPIMKNLARKMRKDTYDPMKAVKLWMYLVDDGAKKYTKEMGSPGDVWHEMWPRKIRLRVAMDLSEQFEEDVANESHDLEKLSMRESKGNITMVTKTQLTEMVRKTIRAQLNEAAGQAEWNLLETLRAHMGDSDIVDELMRAMSSRDAVENLEHIMTMHDIPYEEEEEEDEEDDSMDGDFDSGMASAGFGTDEDYGM